MRMDERELTIKLDARSDVLSYLRGSCCHAIC